MDKPNRKYDAMGLALQAYMQGQHQAEIIVHSNIAEEDVIPVQYLFRTEDEMPAIEKQAREMCYGKVLDVGAGAGSHALALQNKSLQVTALDISAGAVEVMKQRGVKKAIRKNVFKYSGQQFDTILMLMNGIGVAGTLDGLDALLDHLKTLLRPGGQVLLDSSDILYMF
ncbi:MAG: class I SAM-dependent methyltransferase, partial [Hymenobacteraceae bacterium]|nr:class I SAM-dependent methyltransferase [Hymenobacteraceae bacterium]